MYTVEYRWVSDHVFFYLKLISFSCISQSSSSTTWEKQRLWVISHFSALNNDWAGTLPIKSLNTYPQSSLYHVQYTRIDIRLLVLYIIEFEVQNYFTYFCISIALWKLNMYTNDSSHQEADCVASIQFYVCTS